LDENRTVVPGIPLLFASTTVAVIVDGMVPSCDTLAGLAVRRTLETAAAPMVIESDDVVEPVPLPDPTEPENAVTVAVPDWVPASNVTTALPLLVVAVLEANEPRVVVKVTVVPFETAAPPLSTTVAVICVVPLRGKISALLDSVMVAPVGAKSGDWWQPEPAAIAARTRRTTAGRPRETCLALTVDPRRDDSGIMDFA
jgi:hypothetical protein